MDADNADLAEYPAGVFARAPWLAVFWIVGGTVLGYAAGRLIRDSDSDTYMSIAGFCIGAAIGLERVASVRLRAHAGACAAGTPATPPDTTST